MTDEQQHAWGLSCAPRLSLLLTREWCGAGHGSDAVESAQHEIGLWFKPEVVLPCPTLPALSRSLLNVSPISLAHHSMHTHLVQKT